MGRLSHLAETLPRAVFAAFVVLSLVLIGHMALYLARQAQGMGIDFAVFHMVGQLIRQGRLEEAYSVQALSQFEFEATGLAGLFTPWAYPPQGNFLALALALLPLVPSYVIYVSAGYGAYLAALWRVEPGVFRAVFLLIFPTLLIEINTGQNGFVTGTLAGVFALAMGRGGALAGVPLGLLAFKPQLGVGLAVYVLLKRRWEVIGGAMATLALVAGLATLVFGPQVWGWFLAASAEASANLKAGNYPLRRMVSAYATLASLGVPGPLALAGQGVAALLALGVIWWGHRRGLAPREGLGLALVATLAVSPYGYDYDLPIFGVGAALLMPAVRARAGRGEVLILGAAYWGAAGTGLWGYLFQEGQSLAQISDHDHQAVTLAGGLYLGVMIWLAQIVGRPRP